MALENLCEEYLICPLLQLIKTMRLADIFCTPPERKKLQIKRERVAMKMTLHKTAAAMRQCRNIQRYDNSNRPRGR